MKLIYQINKVAKVSQTIRWWIVLLQLFILTACMTNGDMSQSYQFSNDSLTISENSQSIKLSALANGAIEVEFTANGIKQLNSFAIKEDIKKQPASFSESSSEYLFSAKKLRATISKKDLSIRFYRGDQLLTTQMMFNRKDHKLDFLLNDDEKIMGGGQRVLGMDRRGHRMPLYNRAHYGYTTESNQMYYSLPLVISDRQYSILFDNTASGFLDIGKTKSDTLSFEADSGRMAYMVFSGSDYPSLINEYVQVTGTQPMPPRWAFGNFSSRFGYKNQQQVLDTIDQFIASDMPVDSIILDLYWFGNDIKGFMGNLDWDKETFPQPKEMIAQLKEKGIKTILVTEPFVLSNSSRWQDAVDKKILMKDENGEPKRFDFYFGNTGLIDLFDERGKKWFSNIYSDLTQQGVAGVWGDLGEPEVHPDDGIHFVSEMNKTYSGKTLHNVYGHEWAKLVYQNQLEQKPNERPFIMMRSGFAGTQRYGMIPWTGDVSRSWDGLKPQVELSLQMGLQGLAYTHSDLGGFAGGEAFDKEMYIRWLQYGVFQPVFRPHAQDNIAPEPIFHDQQTQDIIRRYLKLRYRLLPYLYSMAYQNSTTGMPLMRPLMFDDQNDKSLLEIKDKYYWGDAMLVAPIVEPNLTSKSVQLPKGQWFDFWTDTFYQGGQKIDYPVSLETIPVFIKAGSFVPMVNPHNNTESYSSERLTIHYYTDDSVSSSQYQMYEDDGKSGDSLQSGAYELIDFNSKNSKASLNINLKHSGAGYVSMPNQRSIELVIHHLKDIPKGVVIADKALNKDEYRYDSKTETVTITFVWQHSDMTVSIKK